MKMRDAQKYVNRLTLAEIRYFAAVGLAFESNLLNAAHSAKLESDLRKRPPMMSCKFAKPPARAGAESRSP